MTELLNKHCRPIAPGTPALPAAEIDSLASQVPGWTASNDQISRTYRFRNFHETMAFVNAVAWIAHQEDHHPDLEVGYNRCTIRFSTHSVGGLSTNDFICAARVEAIASPALPAQT